MPKNKKLQKLSAVLLLTLSATNLVFAKDFSDVPKSHPNFAAINFLSDTGVIAGYQDGSFKPSQLVNRAEALKLIFLGINSQIDESIATANLFKDIKGDEWFAKFVAYAKSKGIVSGNPDGTYAPGRNVKRAELMKMLLNSVSFKQDNWKDKNIFADVPVSAWYNPFMNYAGSSGLVVKDTANKVYPEKDLSRAEVAEILYVMQIILRGKDSQFLISQSETQMAQVEIYIGAGNVQSAKRASELSVDLTQQALKNLPDNKTVLGAAKLAKAYDFLVKAFILGLQKDYAGAKENAEYCIQKAKEAVEVNPDIKTIADHLTERANEIISQLPK